MPAPPPRAPLPLVTEAEPLPPTGAFRALCAGFGIELEPAEELRLGRFLALLLANDALLNLTAIRDPAAGWERHVFDALTVMAVLSELEGPAMVVDIGSGSGVPALPLATVFPQHAFHLVESTRKKADYLVSTARALGLANVTVHCRRAEELARDRAFRRKVDVVTARAVGALDLLARLGAPLLAPGGRCVFIKGQKAAEELEAAGSLIGRLGLAHEGTLDTPTGKLVVLAEARGAG